MVERQPGRPSESGFIGAAVRYLGDEYEQQAVLATNGFMSQVHYFFPGKDIDIEIIRTEQQCDGLLGTPESLRQFAVRQLAMYRKSHKD